MASVDASDAAPAMAALSVDESPATPATDGPHDSTRTVHAADDKSAASQQQQSINGTAAAASEPAAAPSTPSKLSVDVEELSSSASLDAEALAALHRWLACICVVTFDLEMGPTLEYCYPPGYLSQVEITNGQSTKHSATSPHCINRTNPTAIGLTVRSPPAIH